jgi:trans-2,3-dihydro-3-hydroxyanthranilate isomerase
MSQFKYYIVDVFANQRYEGNQLAVFMDPDNQLSDHQMQQMAKEINFAESTFVKKSHGNARFEVRIFTPEHEVPFAGHPTIGTTYVIAKFLIQKPVNQVTLAYPTVEIPVKIFSPDNIDQSLLMMQQSQPEFRETFSHQELAKELDIPIENLNTTKVIQEISTGLPYIIVPLKNLKAMETLNLSYHKFRGFLEKRFKYRTNSASGHSTSLFFFTDQAYGSIPQYNTRMMLLENGRLSEDAATGSANGCFLAYLLKHEVENIKTIVEQGFQMGRKSYLYLDGQHDSRGFQIQVGGHTKLISEGVWYN